MNNANSSITLDPSAPRSAQVPEGGSRRRATQARSRATVAVILEAAGQLLVETGFRGASTNAIARRAGVSVGSLYQYFASREDVFRALAARHREAMHALAAQAVARIEAGAEPAEALPGLLEAMVEAHRADPGLMHAMKTQLDHLETESDRAREARALEEVVARVARRLPGPEDEARARVWLAGEIIAALARRLGHQPPSRPEPRVVRRVLGELLAALVSPPPRRGRPGSRRPGRA